jgi:hypothetical protein
MFKAGKCTNALFLFLLFGTLAACSVPPPALSEQKAQALITDYLKPFVPITFTDATLAAASGNQGTCYRCKLTARDPSTNDTYTVNAAFFFYFDSLHKQYAIDKQAGSLADLYQQRAFRLQGRSLAHEMKHVQSWEMH